MADAPFCTTVNPSQGATGPALSSGTGVAPTCSLPAGATGPGIAITLPTIPQAVDLPSAIAAVNALRLGFMLMSGQLKPQATSVTPGHGSQGGYKFKEDGNKKKSRWSEQSRVSETVKIKNPDDENQFVEVKRINKLTMKDGQTGEQWVWNRGD